MRQIWFFSEIFTLRTFDDVGSLNTEKLRYRRRGRLRSCLRSDNPEIMGIIADFGVEGVE